MANPQNQTNGHEEQQGAKSGEGRPTPPREPSAKEVTEAAAKIVASIGDFPPDHQRRVLESAAVLLGVARQPSQRGGGSSQSNQRPQNRGNGNR
jgi:hypothetical protein